MAEFIFKDSMTEDFIVGPNIESRDEADAIMLEKDGVIGSIPLGCSWHPDIRAWRGYGYRAITYNTEGSGHFGTMRLIPTTKRTRAISRQARRRYLVSQGIDPVDAKAVVWAASNSRRRPHKFEEDVQFVAALDGNWRREHWRRFPVRGGYRLDKWAEKHSVDLDAIGLSFPRLTAVGHLAAATRHYSEV